jgi:hypothetical protein
MRTWGIGLAAFACLASTVFAQKSARPVPSKEAEELASLEGDWVLSFKDRNGVSANLRLTFPKTANEHINWGWDSKGTLGKVAEGIVFRGDGEASKMEIREFKLIEEKGHCIIRINNGDDKPIDLPYEVKDGELILKAPLIVKEIVQHQLLRQRWEEDLKEKDRWVKVKAKENEKVKK